MAQDTKPQEFSWSDFRSEPAYKDLSDEELFSAAFRRYGEGLSEEQYKERIGYFDKEVVRDDPESHLPEWKRRARQVAGATAGVLSEYDNRIGDKIAAGREERGPQPYIAAAPGHVVTGPTAETQYTKPQERRDPTDIGYYENLFNSYLEGSTLGGGGEMIGGLAAYMNLLGYDDISEEELREIGREARKGWQAYKLEGNSQYPATSLITEIVTGLPASSMIPFARFEEAKPLVSGAKGGAAVGAAAGALYADEDHTGGRTGGAALGALIGTPLGALGSKLTQEAGRAIAPRAALFADSIRRVPGMEPIVRGVTGRSRGFTESQRQASRDLQDRDYATAVQAVGETVNDANPRAQTRTSRALERDVVGHGNPEHSPRMLADTNNESRDLARYVLNSSEGDDGRAALQARVFDQPGRVSEATRFYGRSFDEAVDFVRNGRRAETARLRADVVAPRFNADGTPVSHIPLTRQVLGDPMMRTDMGRRALRIAEDRIRANHGDEAAQEFAQAVENMRYHYSGADDALGAAGINSDLSAEQLLAVKESFEQVRRGLRTEDGRAVRAGSEPDDAMLSGFLQSRLVPAMRRELPGYGEYLDVYGDYSALLDAMNTGRDIVSGKIKPNRARSALNDMNPLEGQFVLIGVGEGIIDSVARNANPARSLSTGQRGDVLRELFPDSQEWSNFQSWLRQLGEETETNLLAYKAKDAELSSRSRDVVFGRRSEELARHRAAIRAATVGRIMDYLYRHGNPNVRRHLSAILFEQAGRAGGPASTHQEAIALYFSRRAFNRFMTETAPDTARSAAGIYSGSTRDDDAERNNYRGIEPRAYQ